MLVSVIVPTCNRRDSLERALDAIGAQHRDGWDLEIIVVSDGSTDGTVEMLAARDDTSLTVIDQDNAGPAAARNAGLEAAAGDLVVFIDDDVVAEPGCIAAHVRAHRGASTPTVVIGPLLTPSVELSPYVSWEQRMLEKQYDALGRGEYEPSARQFYTGNASCLRSVLVSVGGFSDQYLRAEDVELGYRLADAGLTFSFEAQAEAYHFAERSFASWIAIAASYGENDVRFWRDHDQTWLVPQIRKEFGRRHRLIQTFTRVGVRFPLVRKLVSYFTPRVVESRLAERLPTVRRGLLSAAYNLEYFSALAAEIGGFSVFLRQRVD